MPFPLQIPRCDGWLRALFAAVAVWVAMTSAVAGQELDVIGTVQDRYSTAALGNAWVILDDRVVAVTDSAGRFVMPAVTEGRHRLVVRRIGYGMVAAELSVDSTAASVLPLSVGAPPSGGPRRQDMARLSLWFPAIGVRERRRRHVGR